MTVFGVQVARRVIAAFVMFIALSVLASKYEHQLTHPLIQALRDRVHLSFTPVHSPKPAVPVNTLTLLVVVRSLVVLFITFMALRFQDGRWTEAGVVWPGWGRHYCLGALVGTVAITALVVTLWARGNLAFEGIQLRGSEIAVYGVRWLIGIALVGVAEECLFHGYAFLVAKRYLGRSLAVFLSAALFTWAHTGNPGETALGLLQIFIFGAVCGLSVLQTGSVWWAVGFHGFWDWTLKWLFGTFGSGYRFDGHLFQFGPRGQEALSGGGDGPEASILASLLLLTIMAYQFHTISKRTDRSEKCIYST